MICEEVYYLHTSISQVEFEARYAEVAAKGRMDYQEFTRYFAVQWILGNFTNWKIYCSEPGITSTNNALESFNNFVKKSYTLYTRHSLLALVEIFMERLLFDYSMDIKELRKCFKLGHLLAIAVDTWLQPIFSSPSAFIPAFKALLQSGYFVKVFKEGNFLVGRIINTTTEWSCIDENERGPWLDGQVHNWLGGFVKLNWFLPWSFLCFANPERAAASSSLYTSDKCRGVSNKMF
jgi:hypothetical protein